MDSCILVIDDENYYRSIISKTIRKNLKYKVITASNGLEGVEACKKHLPSLITMDLYMPTMNGVEATRLIKTLDPSAKILVVSGSLDNMAIKKIIDYGALDFFKKPFTEDELLRKICALLNITFTPGCHFWNWLTCYMKRIV